MLFKSLLIGFVAIVYGIHAALLGVDFGQQFIKAMCVSPQAPLELVLTPESKRKDVSGLALKRIFNSRDIERFFGSAIGSFETRFPQNVALHLKPLLGKSLNDVEVQKYVARYPAVNITETDRNTLAITVDNVVYPIEELVAMNLQEITKRAKELLTEKGAQAGDVIDMYAYSIPNYYNQRQRKAFIDTSSLMYDPHDEYLVNDDLSVAINFALNQHHNWDTDKPYYYIIFDMGSGSTRSSLYSFIKPTDNAEPIKIEFGGYGFNKVGGSDFTAIVSDLVKEKFLEKHNKKGMEIKLNKNVKALAKINQVAEKIKMVLSANSDASGSIESLIDDIDFKVTITRDEFEEKLQEFQRGITEPIENTLTNQFGNFTENVSIDQLTGLILTGGSTRVPFVQNCLSKIFDDEKILKNVNADESTVNGVTLRGIKLFDAFKTKPLNIIERSIYNYTLNYENSTGTFNETIFQVGDVFPSKRNINVTMDADLKKFNLATFEDNNLLTNITVKNVAGFNATTCPDGVQFNLAFELDDMRISKLNAVKAQCLNNEDADDTSSATSEKTSSSSSTAGSSQNQRVKSKFSYPVNAVFEEVDTIMPSYSDRKRMSSMIKIRTLDATDKKRVEIQEAKNLLESTLYDARNFLTEDEVIEKGSPEYVEKLSAVVDEYLEWLEEDFDDSSKDILISRLQEVKEHKGKIEFFLNTLDVELDIELFENLLERADLVLNNQTNPDVEIIKPLSSLENVYSEVESFNITEAYEQVTLTAKQNEDLAMLKSSTKELESIYPKIEKMVTYDTLDEFSREDLLELKINLEKLINELESNKVIDDIMEYRLAEVQALYQRKLRAQRRKLQREMKKLANQKAANNFTESLDGESFTFEPNQSTDSTTSSVESAESIQSTSSTSADDDEDIKTSSTKSAKTAKTAQTSKGFKGTKAKKATKGGKKAKKAKKGKGFGGSKDSKKPENDVVHDEL